MVLRRVRAQGQVVRGIGPRAGEPVALDRLCDGVGERDRVAGVAALHGVVARALPPLHLDDRPRDRSRVSPVHRDGVKAIEAQVVVEPADPALPAILGHRRALVDAPAVGHHDGRDQAAVLAAPPAWGPIGPALLLECAVAEERDQPLPGQGHVDIGQTDKAQVSPLAHAAGGERVDVAADRGLGPAVGPNGVAVEVAHKAGEFLVAQPVTLLVFGEHVPDDHVERIDRGDAVPLLHDPRARQAAQRVGRQVTRVADRHVQRAPGVPLGFALEVGGLQCAPIQVHVVGVGHVYHQPHRRAGHAVHGGQQVVQVGGGRRGRSFPVQHRDQLMHANLCLFGVTNHAVARGPSRKARLCRAEARGAFFNQAAIGHVFRDARGGVGLQTHGAAPLAGRCKTQQTNRFQKTDGRGRAKMGLCEANVTVSAGCFT